MKVVERDQIFPERSMSSFTSRPCSTLHIPEIKLPRAF